MAYRTGSGIALGAVVTAMILAIGCTVDFGKGAGLPDAAPVDAAAPDAQSDGAVIDAAPLDAGPPDAAQMDATVTCGDGVLDPSEQCDDGMNNSDTAPNACRNNCWLPWCGDGVVDTAEQCDDGVGGNSDTAPNACRTTCVVSHCGDSVVDTGEQCDDGNSVSTDACRNNCVSAVCGDGLVWSGQEACDDGNTTAGDGCGPTCSVESLPDLRWLSSVSSGWSTPWLITYAGQIHAPTTPIRAAIALEAVGRVMLFTQSTYHLLRIPQLTWADSGTIAGDFDFMPAAGPTGGYGLQGAGLTSGITLVSGHWAYVYDYTHSNGNITFVVSDDIDTNQDWSTPEAPNPNLLTAMYLDLTDFHGWVNDSLFTACGTGPGSVVGYAVSLTSTQLHLQEIGNCFDFYDVMGFSAFPPYGNSVSGRPTLSQIAGTFYFDSTNTLYVVSQP